MDDDLWPGWNRDAGTKVPLEARSTAENPCKPSAPASGVR